MFASKQQEFSDDIIDQGFADLEIMLNEITSQNSVSSILYQPVKTLNQELQALSSIVDSIEFDYTTDDTYNHLVSVDDLLSAIRCRSIERLRELLLRDASVLHQEYNEPLFAAIKSCGANIDILKILLFYGANVNQQNYYSNTPLDVAIRNHNQKVVKTLLYYGANVNYQDNDGNTVLHKTVILKRGRLISLLSLFLEDPRTDLNIKNKQGECLVSLMLDKFNKLGEGGKKGFSRHLMLLAKYYDRLNDDSKLIIRGNSEFNATIEGYRRKLLQLPNVLNQPSSSSYSDDFLNIK